MRSNVKHRPIGLGVQGLADVMYRMKIAYDSHEGAQLNARIFETIYHGSVRASIDLARHHGPYDTWKGSLYSGEIFSSELNSGGLKPNDTDGQSIMQEKCLLQFDLWKRDSKRFDCAYTDWDDIKQDMKQYGLRNSLLTAVMPTASTSQILGNYEGIEWPQSNVYRRSTSAGSFVVINKYLIAELKSLGMWTDSVRGQLITDNGSVQDIRSIPDTVRARYKTAWEIKQKVTIDMAVDRGIYVDQSQSMNLYMDTNDTNRVFNALYYGWQRGLKTSMYYLRSTPAASATKFSVSPTNVPPTDGDVSKTENAGDSESCDMCSG